MTRKETVSNKEPVASTLHIPKSLVQLNDSISFESQTAFHFPRHSHPRHHISRFPFVKIHTQTKIIFMA